MFSAHRLHIRALSRKTNVFFAMIRLISKISIKILIAALIFSWAVSRACYPTAFQLSSVEKVKIYNHKSYLNNAHAAIWLLDYSIPESDFKKVMENDRNIINKKIQDEMIFPYQGKNHYYKIDYQSFAEGRYRKTIFFDGKLYGRYCSPDKNCLMNVSSDLEFYENFFRENKDFIERLSDLKNYDAYVTDFDVSPHTPLPDFSKIKLLPLWHAYSFVTGREDYALDETCKTIFSFRKIAARSDNVLAMSVFDSIASEVDARLLMDMLEEYPADKALPASCASLMEPVDISWSSICRAAKEWYEIDLFRIKNEPLFGGFNQGNYGVRLMDWVLYDREATGANLASKIDSICSNYSFFGVGASQLSMRNFDNKIQSGFECFGNISGCIIVAERLHYYFVLLSARLDYSNARMRLLAFLVSFREGYRKDSKCVDQDGVKNTFRSYGLHQREVKYSSDDRIAMLIRGKGQQFFELPVPRYLRVCDLTPAG